ncbi:hypothetical protein [Bradyrhizobium sp. 150]|uniref:hypothetical protein n=1 Tax=Bradyrhizobium sp. 150 TaxID=2782625 RepID=UPI001FFACE98|nr:hypothetical protein [Bradyrhizobium sp. 150]MCK1672784.1 hypothetical protein [Bradyrhizobium sp. 150]
MGKRFLPVKDADRRALELYFMLKQVEQMPLVEIEVSVDSKTPILIQDKSDRHYWKHLTIDTFLSLSVEQAKAEGGTARALMCSQKKSARPRVPQSEVDRGVSNFFSGDDDE